MTGLLNDELLTDIFAHAKETMDRECCGLIVTYRRRKTYIPVRNIAEHHKDFMMHPQDQADAEDKGTVLAVVHSHPKTKPQPTQADLVFMNMPLAEHRVPWVIVNPRTGQHTVTEPSGYEAPLVGREFSHGILDCYTIVRDYYQRTLGITLKDYARPDNWWLKGMDLYRDNFADTDFIEVKDGSLQLHDFLLIQVASPVANHGAIYLGDSENRILHHVAGKVSGRDAYGGYWRKCTRAVLRHKKLFREVPA
jgi:proteasome lid subunit RPN8/RPN11